MKMKRYSVQKLNRLSAHFTIWCVGCGKRFNEIIGLYKDERFVAHIDKIMDNNPDLWGKEKVIGKRRMEISGIICTDGNKKKDILIIITSDQYEEIYAKISQSFIGFKITYVSYPVHYHSYSKIIMGICSKMPLKRQILFHAGDEPHENADEITNYLKYTYKKAPYQIVYVGIEDIQDDFIIHINKNALRLNTEIKKIIRYCYYYATSRYLFYENEPLAKVRDEQKLIYLNHGTIPLKKVKDVLRQPPDLDYAVCPSPGCSKIYEAQYGVPKVKQIFMMPSRVNALFRQEIDMAWLKGNRKLILWLPTFRQLKGTERRDSNIDKFEGIIESKHNWDELDRCLKYNQQILVIKNHPREKYEVEIPEKLEFIRILKNEELEKRKLILQEVLAQTEAILTDYSGIAFEYMLLDRPIGYIIHDLNDYTRGFSVDCPLDYMPGEKISSFDQLICFFQNVCQGMDLYGEQRKHIVSLLFQKYAYKNGTELLVDRMNKGQI